MLCSRFLHLAIVAAACAAAPYGVQAQQARFFTPLNDAGSQQQSQGLYGTLEALYWNIAPGKETQIGYTNPAGGTATREVYLGGRAFTQQNSLTSSILGEGNACFGMRAEIGSVRDHHGWLISGYGLPSQTAEKTITGNTSMVIQDDGFWEDARVSTQGFQSVSWIWDPQQTLNDVKGEALQHWGPFSGTTWFNRNEQIGGLLNNLGPGWNPGGALYWDGFDLTGNKLGWQQTEWQIYELTDRQVRPGLLWGYIPLATEQQGFYTWDGATYTAGNRLITYYGVAPMPVIFTEVSVKNRTSNWSTEAMYTYRLHPIRCVGIDFLAGLRYCELDDNFSVDATGEFQHHYPGVANTPVSILNATSLESSSYNRIVGPQFGVRVQRNNERWAALAEFRLFAGFNNIEMKNNGFFASAITARNNLYVRDMPIVPGEPMGLMGSSNVFKQRRVKNEFSPGFEFRLNSSWRLTRQISLQAGFTTLVVDKVVRGAAINDYRIHSNNEFFGIRDDNEMFSTLITYGLNIGLVVNRF